MNNEITKLSGEAIRIGRIVEFLRNSDGNVAFDVGTFDSLVGCSNYLENDKDPWKIVQKFTYDEEEKITSISSVIFVTFNSGRIYEQNKIVGITQKVSSQAYRARMVISTQKTLGDFNSLNEAVAAIEHECLRPLNNKA